MAEKQETKIETITMQDGRVVEFAGKRKLLKETTIDKESGTVKVRLDLRNGATRLFTVPDNMVLTFAGHGAEQKLGDEIAGLDKVEDCELALDELIDRLYNGEWSMRSGNGSMAGTSVLLRALVELYSGKRTPEDIKAFLAKKSQKEKLALRANGAIKPIVDRLEAEAASKGTAVDTDALMNELDNFTADPAPAAA